MKFIALILVSLSCSLFAQSFEMTGTPELFAPGIVSVGSSQVKITFSKDGNIMLWGEIGRENGMGGLDIWMSEKSDSGWANPQPVSFNTSYNDFDPVFSVDGKKLYFFSNRPGGIGGEDIYVVDYDPINRSFDKPVNIGNEINTPGDEWGPVESIDGQKFLFCTDSAGGKGKHDIFVCEKKDIGWTKPVAIEAINSEEDDFDPVFLKDCTTILFTRKINEDEAYLYISYLKEDGYTAPERVTDSINVNGSWNFGSSISRINPDCFYYSTFREDSSQGKLDIYMVGYKLKGADKE